MKRLTLITLTLTLLAFTAPCWAAPFLVCKPVTETIWVYEAYDIGNDTTYTVSPQQTSLGVRLHFDTAILSDGDYTFRVRGINAAGPGGWSVDLPFTVPIDPALIVSPPVQPANLVFTEE
jgi:hypothetical protein